MSKCKAVLDSEKITEIRVKIKTQESPPQDKSESEDSDKSNEDSHTAQSE
jgi:hypothetical protein